MMPSLRIPVTPSVNFHEPNEAMLRVDLINIDDKPQDQNNEPSDSYLKSSILNMSTIDRMSQFLAEKFNVHQRGSTIRTEIQAGFVLFATSAYMFIMNPNILAIANIDKNYTYITTILVSVLGTSIASLVCNLPLIIAPAMGLNTLMAMEMVTTKKMPVLQVLGAAFFTGLVFIVLSHSGIILKLNRRTPICLKKSIIVSIGLFQAVIGMTALGFIQPASPMSGGVSTIGDHLFTSHTLVACITIFITVIMVAYGSENSLLYGIVGGSVIGKLLGDTVSASSPSGGTLNHLVGKLAMPPLTDASIIPFLACSVTIFLVTFIDCGGVLMALASQAVTLQDEDGMMQNSQRVFIALGVTGMFSAFIGCSPPVVLLESAAGISLGARTGLASLVATFLFLLCLLFRGLVDFVPASVGHAVLIIVGSFMMGAVTGISWDNVSESFPAYATIIATVFTCSLANGASTGFITYAVLNIPLWFTTKRVQETSEKAFSLHENELDIDSLGRRISISDWTYMGQEVMQSRSHRRAYTIDPLECNVTRSTSAAV
eukprot:GHVH01000242.1.p1 GENE.GHVH01000242.1~~GHVH01000242.1.p1  ORF type:complete len:544 (-),score=34.98 GHVH01000242.1:57-1688(-)